MGLLAHSPRSVVSVWPTRAVPVIAGSRVIAGATAGWTTAEGAENAGALGAVCVGRDDAEPQRAPEVVRR